MAIEPNNAMLYRWRGHRYLSVRELDKAQADLTKGLKLDSTVECWAGVNKYGETTPKTGAFPFCP